MAVKKQKPKFEASDGTEFESEAEANAYDERITATKEYAEARERMLTVLARTHKTADGHSFEYGDYWVVRDSFNRDLHIVNLTSLGSRWQEYEIGSDESIELVLRDEGRGKERTTIRISELYKSRKAAFAKLIEKVKERQDQLAKQLAGIEEDHKRAWD